MTSVAVPSSSSASPSNAIGLSEPAPPPSLSAPSLPSSSSSSSLAPSSFFCMGGQPGASSLSLPRLFPLPTQRKRPPTANQPGETLGESHCTRRPAQRHRAYWGCASGHTVDVVSGAVRADGICRFRSSTRRR
eukprot:GHVT01102439.1.p2 GENE.GHVT01102439.1~~GHVT01102439.1.p2  ORF type:complete len:133 (+),score=38.36 GHVT01102439.1:669-1067(+)